MLTRLCIATHPAAVWSEAVEPWLRTHGGDWRCDSAVLTPNAAWVAALKGMAVNAGSAAVGISWMTPGRFRSKALRLLPGKPLRVALREDLHLLLELAAEQLPENMLARAYGGDPAPFQQLLDALDSAGWDANILPDAAAREFAGVAKRLRTQAGWVSAAEADRLLRDAAESGGLPQLGGNLLAVGFGPDDWESRPLLETVAAVYSECEFVLDAIDPDMELARAWVGTWEEAGGLEAQWIEAEGQAAPFAYLAELLREKPSPARPDKEASPVFWLADDVQAEADLAVGQGLEFLAETGNDKLARVGIVVGAMDSPLAGEVSARLAVLGIPHHDAPGHLPGRPKAQILFEAWLDWQENGRLAGLVSWLRVARIHGLYNGRAADDIEETLKKASQQTLADDPAVLAAWLAHQENEASESRQFLADWPRLPEKMSWDEWIETIIPITEKLGWPEPPDALKERAVPLAGALGSTVPRASMLRWVRAVTRVPGRTRETSAREPFAPLQIVDASGAAATAWTHLVLAGLQHGEWPAEDFDLPLLDGEARAKLNRAALRQGSQGEGHLIAVKDKSPLPDEGERRRIARAQFIRLTGLPTHGLALTSRLADPGTTRPSPLSPFYWACAARVLGRMPDDNGWDKLAQVSRRQRNQLASIFSKSDSTRHPQDTETGARAFKSRRDLERPFDVYSFCLAQRPLGPIRLSCKTWESAATGPAAAWFRHLLGVEPKWDAAKDDPAALVLGLWAHDFVRFSPGRTALHDALLESQALPSGELWEKVATSRALDIRAMVAKVYADAGRSLPEFWNETWSAALRAALHWIGALAVAVNQSQAFAEAVLPKNLDCILPEGSATLPISGRLDLALTDRAAVFAPGGLHDVAAWLVDFKSGGNKPLTLAQLKRGEGLQLALYALALRTMGAARVSMTLLTRDAAQAEAQLEVAELGASELAGVWKLLEAFSVEGRWGDFCGFNERSEVPSATLTVSSEILEQKWNLTHPYFRK